ncbi:MAG: hypothetical protein PVJ67_02615 [Candidatus Pacearchaeota archaeon]|jgi:hypothetical protein
MKIKLYKKYIGQYRKSKLKVNLEYTQDKIRDSQKSIEGLRLILEDPLCFSIPFVDDTILSLKKHRLKRLKIKEGRLSQRLGVI